MLKMLVLRGGSIAEAQQGVQTRESWNTAAQWITKATWWTFSLLPENPPCPSCVLNIMLRRTLCQIPGSFLKPSVLRLAWLVSEDESKENIIFVIYTLGVIHSFNSFICSAGLCQVLCYFEKPAVPAGGRAEEIAINSYDFPRKLSTVATNSFTVCSASPPDHPNVTVTTSKVSLHVFW